MLLNTLTGQMPMAEKSVDSRVRRTTRRRTPGSWLRHLLRLDGGDGSSRRLLAQPFLDYYVILATTVLLCGSSQDDVVIQKRLCQLGYLARLCRTR